MLMMNFFRIFLLPIVFAAFASAQNAPEILRFKTRIVFNDGKEMIAGQKIFDNDTKIVFVGVKTIEFRDLITGEIIESRSHEIPDLDRLDTFLQFSPDGGKVVVLDSFSWRLIRKEKKVSASVYDLRSDKRLAVLERPTESIRAAEWSENGETLVTYSGIYNAKRTEVCFWNGGDLKFRASILLKGDLRYKKLLRNGETFLAQAVALDSYGVKKYIETDYLTAWDTATAKPIRNFSSNGDSQGGFFGRILTSNEKYAVMTAGRYDKQRVSVWRLDGGESPIYEIASQKKGGAVDLLSVVGDYFFTYQDKTIEMRDAADGELKFSIPNQKRFTGHFRTFTLSPDGKNLAIDDCEKAEFFDAASGTKKFEIDLVCKTDFDYVSTSYRDFDVLRFHPNGKTLLTASDKTVRLWNAENGKLLQTLADPNKVEMKRKDENKDDGLGSQADWVSNGDFVYASGKDRKSILLWELKK